MADTLVTTRYVKPGVYIGRIIRPAPVTQGFVRTVCYVAKGSKRQLQFNVPIRRSFISGQSLNFSAVAPYQAPLPYDAKPDQIIASLVDSSGVVLPKAKWKFIQSTVGVGLPYDYVQISPDAFNPLTTYSIDYQSTSRTVKDAIPFSDLRQMKLVGDTEDQNKYQENIDFRIPVAVSDPVVGTATTLVGHFSSVTHTGTGTATLTPTGAYAHPYSRLYTVKVIAFTSGVSVKLRWESVALSGGNAALPNVPLISPVSPSDTSLPTETVLIPLSTATTSLTTAYPGVTGDPASVSINIATSTGFVVGDTYQFAAYGIGLVELDTSYASDATQYSTFSAVEHSLLTVSTYPWTASALAATTVISINNKSSFTGLNNRTYVVQVKSITGSFSSGTIVFGWQAYGEVGYNTGYKSGDTSATTINYTTDAQTVDLGDGVILNITMTGALSDGTSTPADVFLFTANAARRYPNAKDDRNYTLTVNSIVTPGIVQATYVGDTIEASFGTLSTSPSTGADYSWALGNTYTVPSNGDYSIPGDYILHFRNLGITTPTSVALANRYTVNDTFTFSSTDSLEMDWALNNRSIETILPGDVHTDTLGLVTNIQGSKYVILNHIPAGSGILYARSKIGTVETPLSVSAVSLGVSPYVSIPSYPTGAKVIISYEWIGQEPDPGNVYKITADIKRPGTLFETPIIFYSQDDMRRTLGPSSTDNDALIMGDIAFEAGATQIAMCQVLDSAGNGVYTNFDYARSVLATESSKIITDVNVVNNAGSLGTALQSNEKMNDPFEQKERMLWVGMNPLTPIGSDSEPDTIVYTAKNTMQVFGNSPAHGRRVLIGNTTAKRTIALADGSQVQVSLNGSFIAGAIAAKNASFSDPGATLLRASIAIFDEIQDYSESDQLRLGAASVLYLSSQGAGLFRIEESVTVDTISIDNNEISAQNQEIFVTYDVRRQMDQSLIGFVPNSQQQGASIIQATLVTALTGYVSRGIISPYQTADGTTRALDPSSDIQVFRSDTDKVLYNFGFYYFLRYPIKRLFGLFSVDRKLFGASV